MIRESIIFWTILVFIPYDRDIRLAATITMPQNLDNLPEILFSSATAPAASRRVRRLALQERGRDLGEHASPGQGPRFQDRCARHRHPVGAIRHPGQLVHLG